MRHITAAIVLFLLACRQEPAPTGVTPEDNTQPSTPSVRIAASDLLLTEVMALPGGCGDAAQYIELRYLGDTSVDLSGLVLASQTRAASVTTTTRVDPGDYVVLAADGVGFTDCYGLPSTPGLPMLQPTDTLTVSDGVATLFATFDLADFPPVPGAAWQRDAHDDSWCLADTGVGDSGALGSPGAANQGCEAPTDTDTAYTPRTWLPGDLRVTEFMADPRSSDTLGEYIELWNTTADPLDLDGIVLEDTSTRKSVLAGTHLVAPGARALLVHNVADYAASYGILADAPTNLSLNNGGDRIRVSIGTVVLDEVDFQAWKITAGVAWSRDDSGAWCAAATLFGPESERGTPGAPNAGCEVETDTGAPDTAVAEPSGVPLEDCAPGDLRISEVMSNPTACTDPSGEYVELWNTTGHAIALAGLRLLDNSQATATLTTSGIVESGARVLLFSGSSGANCYGLSGIPYTGLGLNNTGGDEVIVTDANGRELDRFDYRALRPTTGVAWSLDDVDRTRWCTESTPIGSTADLGSPGLPHGSCP